MASTPATSSTARAPARCPRRASSTAPASQPRTARAASFKRWPRFTSPSATPFPHPRLRLLQEVRVNASMYDAQQGSTSGAHIDMSTASGTNTFHGMAYVHRGTSWINAAPFFFNQDPDIPAYNKVPQLHRYILGGTFGGPIIKDKLFGFVGLSAPACLRPGNRRLGSRCPGWPDRRPLCLRVGESCQQFVRHRQRGNSTSAPDRPHRAGAVQLARASRRARQMAYPQRRPQRRGSHGRPHRQCISPRHRPVHG